MWYDSERKLTEVTIMRYIMTLIWALALVSMLNYVVSAVINVPFELMNGIIMAVVLTIFIFVIDALLPSLPKNAHH